MAQRQLAIETYSGPHDLKDVPERAYPRQVITPDCRLGVNNQVLPTACFVKPWRCVLCSQWVRDISINICYTSPLPFVYRALVGSDAFRVLQVQPGPFSDPLRCTLSAHGLRDFLHTRRFPTPGVRTWVMTLIVMARRFLYDRISVQLFENFAEEELPSYSKSTLFVLNNGISRNAIYRYV